MTESWHFEPLSTVKLPMYCHPHLLHNNVYSRCENCVCETLTNRFHAPHAIHMHHRWPCLPLFSFHS